MNKEQIVEYLEKELKWYENNIDTLNEQGRGALRVYRHLLTKIKEEPKPVELEVGGYYCDLKYPDHKFKCLRIDSEEYRFIGFNTVGDWIGEHVYRNETPNKFRHLTPDEIKEIDQRSMSGKEVTVIIDGVEYTAVIK